MRKGGDRRKRRQSQGPLWMVVIPAMAVVVGAFSIHALATALQPRHMVVVEFSVQPVERVDPATGIVSVPVVDGYDGPAVQRGHPVPIRGTVIVHGDSAVIVTSSVVWEEVPLGLRVVIRTNVVEALPPGVTRLTFDEPIPPEVSDAVNDGGAHLWRIVGTVSVDAPDAMDAQWATTPFWVVP